MNRSYGMDYVVIGHVTRDMSAQGIYTPGGTVTFASLTAMAFGQRVGVVTQVNAAEDLLPFAASGVQVHRVAADRTTTFENRYIEGVRTQRLIFSAGVIPAPAIPAAWRTSKVAHIGPVFQECDSECILAFDEHTYIGVTPQGWLREADDAGYVSHCRLGESLWLGLTKASAVIISEEDVDNDLDYASDLASRCLLLIVTSGWQGGTVYEKGKAPWPFIAPRVDEVDPTGAGDIFATMFFLMHSAGYSVRDAVSAAACVASRSVTRPGLASVPTRNDIDDCIAPVSKP